MSSLTNTPRGFDGISYPTVRAGSIAETPNNKITSKELDALKVFHFSIPNVQDFGEGQWESGDSIDSDKWIISSESVLISKLNPRKSTVCLAHPRNAVTVSSTEFVAFASGDRHDNKFLYYVLGSAPVTSYLSSLTTSVTRSHQRVQASDIKSMRIPWPEAKRRRKIADYLDHETAEIDSFIADQENLSKLLQERWQSFLVHAIQTGGQGAVQLYSTEVTEWPYAPHRWEKMRLKSTILDSQNGSWGSEPGVESVTRRCIRVADFDKNSGRTHSANETERSYPLSQTKNLELQPGDLIIEKSGGGPTTPVGNTVLYDAPGGDMFSNFVARIRLRSNISPLFAVYLHRSLYLNQITQRSIKQTTGIQNLDAGSYFNETIFLPPLEEQKSIGRSIEENRIETEASLQVIEKAIDLARERRAALITAAVTGQIDVTARNKPAAEQLEDDIAQGLHREYA